MLCALILPIAMMTSDLGRECLDSWNQRLRAAKTVSGRFTMKGPEIDEVQTFRFARPNFAQISGGGTEVYSDGKTEIAYVKSANKFVKRKARRKFPLIATTAFGTEALAGQESNFEYKGFTEKDNLIQVVMRHKPELFTIISNRVGISGGLDMTLSFLKSDKTLQGFTLAIPGGTLTGSYTDFRFDEAMPKDGFALNIPKDAKPFEKTVDDGKLLSVGSKAPDIQLTSTSGLVVRLSEYVKTRKATLVNFWFYGCGGCMIEFPNISRLHEALSSRGFGLIGIDPIDDLKTAASYHTNGKFSFQTLVSKGSGISPEKLFQVQAYPTNYILGPDMKIIDRYTGEDEDRLLDVLEKQGIRLMGVGS
jgi:peroxiredoxin/outer membrane lipoprotein-sorting protein